MIRYKKTKPRKSFFLTLVLLLLLIFFSHRNPETASLPSGLLNTLLSPMNRILYATSVRIQEFYDTVFGQKSARARLNQLELENHGLKSELNDLRLVVEKEDYLKEEYQLLSQKEDQLIQARVTMQDPSLHFVRFTINKGKKDGVSKGDAVIQGVQGPDGNVSQGLVGYITEVGLNYAKVSSILDQASNLSVLFSKSGEYGIINNRDEESFYGYLLDAQKEISLDEMVVTSGIGGRYPRGLTIGTLSGTELADDGLTKRFSIRPAVSFSHLYRVLVLPGTGDQSIEHLKELSGE